MDFFQSASLLHTRTPGLDGRTIRFKPGRIPLYLQLYWELKDDILLHEMPPGAQLPTVEELHHHYAVSQSTVLKALDLLADEGLISRKQGRGIFIKEDVDMAMWSASSNFTITIEAFRNIKRKGNIELIQAGPIWPPNRVRAVFTGQSEVFRDDRIFKVLYTTNYRVDKRKWNLVESYFPAWLLDTLPRPITRKDMVQKIFLLEFDDFKAAGAYQTVNPWICNAEVGRYLHPVSYTHLRAHET